MYVYIYEFPFFNYSLDDIGRIMIPTGLAFINYIVSSSFGVRQRFHLYLHRRSVQPHLPPLPQSPFQTDSPPCFVRPTYTEWAFIAHLH